MIPEAGREPAADASASNGASLPKSGKRVSRQWKIAGTLPLGAALVAPLLFIWMTAPADPRFNGERLSVILYNAYSAPITNRVTWQTLSSEALRQLGPKAGPLLCAWIEKRPAPWMEKVRSLLLKRGINFPYFTADHQQIVEKLFYAEPMAGVALSDAFQWQILHGEERGAMRAAALMMWVINSVDAKSQAQIADRNWEFASDLLDRFETDRRDNYPLCIVGAILKHTSQPLTPELRARVLQLGSKARYLDSAVEAVKAKNERGPGEGGM